MKLLRTFKAEIDPADHQQWRDQPRREISQDEADRQEKDQLVLQGTKRNFADDRQFAGRGQADDICRGDSCVIDNDTRRLDAGFGGLRCDVIDRRSGSLCNCCNIIKQCDQTGRQCLSYSSSSRGSLHSAHRCSGKG
ncbi:hypothetical protein D3C71_1615160 [compost metagenome]